MEEYHYAALDEGKFEIRLLILLPGEFEEPIQGLLANVQLLPRVSLRESTNPNETSLAPPFEAISYAWGSPEDSVDIAIRSAYPRELALYGINSGVENEDESEVTSEFGTVQVTQNLARALPYLRYRDGPRILWIDALCVNQRDLDERSRQVRRMADVYTKATRVVVWLGRESNDSKLAINTLTKMISKLSYNFKTGVISFSPEATDFDRLVKLDDPDEPVRLQSKAIRSLCCLLERSWFWRLWVWQEIILGSEASIVLCGRDSILWKDLCASVLILSIKKIIPTPEYSDGVRQPVDSELSRTLARELNVLSRLCSIGRHTPLPFLLDITKLAECSDLRDRVYALLSIIRPTKVNIQPDYTQNANYVFQDATANQIFSTHSLEILSSCDLTPERANLPSWVPDLSRWKRSTNLPPGFCVNQTPHPMINENVLTVKGLLVCRIDRIWDNQLDSMSKNSKVVAEAFHLWPDLDYNVGYVAGGTVLQALARTLVANSFRERLHLQSKIWPSESVIEMLGEALSFNKKLLWYQSDLRHYLNVVHTLSDDRKLCMSNRGYLGICPRFSEPGDLIVTVFGSHHPLILRLNGDGTYLLVGEAYCHGIESGEPFLGPLPEQFSCIQGEHQREFLFRNRETGEVRPDDPRLGELPSGWAWVGHDRMTLCNRFRNLETGEEIWGSEFDPRTTPEELEKRGLVFQDFKIV